MTAVDNGYGVPTQRFWDEFPDGNIPLDGGCFGMRRDQEFSDWIQSAHGALEQLEDDMRSAWGVSTGKPIHATRAWRAMGADTPYLDAVERRSRREV